MDSARLRSLADLLFPADLRGRSVLHVGCGDGALCREALRRGASPVVGVAEGPASVPCDCGPAGSPRFVWLDLERGDPVDRFDDVLCLDLLERSANPVTMLDRLIDATRGRLIVGLGGPAPGGGRWPWAWLLDRIPVLWARGREPAGAPAGARFAISAAALRHMLLYHRNVFAGVDQIRRAPGPRCRLLVAHKRRIGRLLVVAGPPSVGKSTLLAAVRAGGAPQVVERLGLGDPARWRPIDAARLRHVAEPCLDQVLLHYNFLSAAMRRTQSFERDERLDPVALAGHVAYLTLWADPPDLLRQYDHVKITPYIRRGRFRGPPRYLATRRFIADPALLLSCYRQWLDYVARHDADPLIVCATDGTRFMDRPAWERHVAALA